MKIQTNQGEVELTAEMVCRGMVFQSDNWIQNHARDGVLTMLHDDPGNPGAWKATVDDLWCFPEHAQRFLGCDPTIATRADCERFGVHGDAAAHGFAKLRDGGALDLRRHLPGGWVIQNASGTYNAGILPWQWPEGARLVGFHARHARPEDVDRLCCGAHHRDVHEGKLRDALCTLVIGDHDMHEDLATGVKWSAKPIAREALAAAMVPSGRDALEGLKRLSIGWCDGRTDLGPVSACVVSDEAAYRWMVTYLGRRIAVGDAPHSTAAYLFATDWLCRVDAASEGIEWLAQLFGLLFKIWNESPMERRRQQEAPLVALVNAVPEGLDPVGWRAAVLAVHEHHGQFADRLRGDLFAEWLAPVLREGLIAGEVDGYHGLGYLEGLAAYQRAIAPRVKVAPERKVRGPMIAVDDGRDDE